MPEDEDIGFDKLTLLSVVGFNGSVPNGLLVHPDRQHLVYSLGCTIIIEDINTKEQEFLHGHTNHVVCLDISRNGKYIASGQETHMGYKADIIVWDFARRDVYAKFILHKVKVQALAFSPNEKYLVSLGGQDDGSVVVWSMAKKEAICGNPAQHKSAGITECLAYSHTSDDIFVTAGDNTVRVWELDLENRKIRPSDCQLGQIKRIIKCLTVSADDEVFYCGTTTGDVLGINMRSQLMQAVGPEKEKLSLGVTSIVQMRGGELIVGAGDGTVQEMHVVQKSEGAKVMPRYVKTSKVQSVTGAVTSISLRGVGHQFYVATDKCHIYRVSFPDFTMELLTTCHYSAINDVKFPSNCSDLFATCSYQDIRIFHTVSQKELLRINIPNMTCYAIDILKDGSAIVSGWDDGKIRAFYPETGRLMYTIHEAHKKGVTAIASTSDCCRVVSGGGEGQIRVWEVQESTVPGGAGAQGYMSLGGRARRQKGAADLRTYVTSLISTMKEHANAVSCIQLNKDNTQCVSSSADGTCIVWCLQQFNRKQIIFANTLFRVVCYHPDECQLITSGTDRKIGYWELYDGCLIRELEGSRSGSVNGMDITSDGKFFVSGGDDKIVKVWKYNEGDVTHVGLGHSTPITRLRIAPNQKLVITVSDDGAIFIWKFPF